MRKNAHSHLIIIMQKRQLFNFKLTTNNIIPLNLTYTKYLKDYSFGSVYNFIILPTLTMVPVISAIMAKHIIITFLINFQWNTPKLGHKCTVSMTLGIKSPI